MRGSPFSFEEIGKTGKCKGPLHFYSDMDTCIVLWKSYHLRFSGGLPKRSQRIALNRCGC